MGIEFRVKNTIEICNILDSEIEYSICDALALNQLAPTSVFSLAKGLILAVVNYYMSLEFKSIGANSEVKASDKWITHTAEFNKIAVVIRRKINGEWHFCQVASGEDQNWGITERGMHKTGTSGVAYRKDMIVDAELQSPWKGEKGEIYVPLIDRRILFSADGQYINYNMYLDKKMGEPRSTSSLFPQERSNPSAAFRYQHHGYVFFQSRYYRLNLDSMTYAASYPLEVNDKTWKGLGFESVDAAFVQKNVAYLFALHGRNSMGYKQFYLDLDKVNPTFSFMQPVADPGWKGIPWGGCFDEAVEGKGNKVYLFKGDQYVRFDTDTGEVEKAYLNKAYTISKYWDGISFDGVAAAL